MFSDQDDIIAQKKKKYEKRKDMSILNKLKH